MPSMQNLVLKDRATTPVDHTFVPANLAGGVGRLVESSGVKVGDSSFSISSRKTPNGRYKATLKLEIPKTEVAVVNGVNVDTVTRVAYATAEFSFDAKSTTAERNNLVGMFADSLAKTKTIVDKTVVDLEGVWG